MEHSNEDAYLLIALRKGEVIAFDSIFKKYYPILCAYGNRFVDNEESKRNSRRRNFVVVGTSPDTPG